MGRKITITVEDREYEQLSEKAKEMGFARVAGLVRFLTINGKPSEKKNLLLVPVNNYEELRCYVEQKKLGSVETFASFSMEKEMSRYPLTAAQKRRAGLFVDE
ncbi:hypothetical protein [Sediminispirochaeta bajacaliforniensis]|uniref:hypothetical protein n=1 Tax=Sediminispirochaeta bajacaliforniensis TaxID=148 RepID=UPI000370F3E0|nr:hypothetical protein [Sediminispirochaeta bajacaliforniensis]